ncbi:MAG: XRE family transcriptional regulator [Chloroflexi bacterium]|nr:XRE family transcriptional regulator [Chloroflexota bacterium]
MSATQEAATSRAVEEAAYRESVQLPIADIAQRLQQVLGQRLVAVLAGVSDAKAVGRWARGERAPHPANETRLRTAYRVTALLLSANAPETIRAWLSGMNPVLDDRSPARVLAENPEEVLIAAREFLANG